MPPRDNLSLPLPLFWVCPCLMCDLRGPDRDDTDERIRLRADWYVEQSAQAIFVECIAAHQTGHTEPVCLTKRRRREVHAPRRAARRTRRVRRAAARRPAAKTADAPPAPPRTTPGHVASFCAASSVDPVGPDACPGGGSLRPRSAWRATKVTLRPLVRDGLRPHARRSAGRGSWAACDAPVAATVPTPRTAFRPRRLRAVHLWFTHRSRSLEGSK
jgi:hypothetical protein